MPVYSYVIANGTVPLAVHLHRGTPDPLESQPAVIVMGSWLTVKEQMADGYAARLADRGYTAVTFDFAGAVVDRFVAAEVAWGTGTQIDFYDRPAQMTFAIVAVDELLRRTPAVSR
jgi:dienelactone hydrolase